MEEKILKRTNVYDGEEYSCQGGFGAYTVYLNEQSNRLIIVDKKDKVVLNAPQIAPKIAALLKSTL